MEWETEFSGDENVLDHLSDAVSNQNEENDDEPIISPRSEKDEDHEEIRENEKSESSKTTHDNEDPNIVILEKDLLAVCNALYTKPSATRTPLPALNNETLINLQDVVNILVQSQTLDSEGKINLAAELLLINPKYQLLTTIFLPLWELSYQIPDQDQFMDKLLFILQQVLQLPDNRWKHYNEIHRIKCYLTALDNVKPALLRPLFWKALTETYQRFRIDLDQDTKSTKMTSQIDMLAKEENELTEKLLKEADPGIAREGQKRLKEIRESTSLLKLEIVKRHTHLRDRLNLFKAFLITLLKLPSSADALANGRGCVPVSEFSLKISVNIVRNSLLDAFESDWREFLFQNLFARSRRRTVNGKPEDSIKLWNILEFYNLFLRSLNPIELAEFNLKITSKENKPPSRILNPVASLSQDVIAASRHSKFNSQLIRQRLAEQKGKYSFYKTRSSTQNRVRKAYRRNRVELSDLRWNVYDAAVSPLKPGFSINESHQRLENFLRQSEVEYICEANENFIRLGLNKFLTSWITDFIAEDAILKPLDAFKVLSLIAWTLQYKRRTFELQQIKYTEQFPNWTKEDKAKQLQALVAEILCLRSSLSGQTIYFINKVFRDYVKAKQLTHGTEVLAKFCFRVLIEQIQLGLFLMKTDAIITAEALNVVGRTIIEDLFGSNIISHVVWCLKKIKVFTHELEFILLTFTVTWLLIEAFQRLGGIAKVHVTHKNTNGDIFDKPLTRSGVKRMELRQFLADLFDDYVISNIMNCLQQYKLNNPLLNSYLIKLLLLVSKETSGAGTHFVVLFFQLSYFDLFLRILSDDELHNRPDGNMLKSFCSWVIGEFWKVFETNKFVVIELFFGKTVNVRSLNYTDSNALLSIYTNYEQGLEKEFFDESFETLSEEWMRKLEEKQRLLKQSWNVQDNKTLIRLWDLKKGKPNCFSLIRHGFNSKRTVKAVIDQLIYLGIIEPVLVDETTAANDYAKPLLNCVLKFRESENIKACWTASLNSTNSKSPNDCIGLSLLAFLNGILEDRRTNKEATDTVIPIPIRTDSEIVNVEEFKELMSALGAMPVEKHATYHWNTRDLTFWKIPTSLRCSDLTARINCFEKYITIPLQELKNQQEECINDYKFSQKHSQHHFKSSQRRHDPFVIVKKLKVLKSIALIKLLDSTKVSTSSDNLDAKTSSHELCHLIHTLFESCVSNLLPNASDRNKIVDYNDEKPILDNIIKTDFFEQHLLPENLSAQNVISAVTAAMENILRRRRQFLLNTGTAPDSSHTYDLGELRFPASILEKMPEKNEMFLRVSNFIQTTSHTVVTYLLRSLGFERTMKQEESEDPNKEIWIYPLSRSLETLDTYLYYLYAYIMSPINSIETILKRYADACSSEEETEELPHQEESLKTEKNIVVPFRVMEEYTQEAVHEIALAINSLRNQMPEGVGFSLKLLKVLADWADDRLQSVESDLDLILTTLDSEITTNKTNQRCISLPRNDKVYSNPAVQNLVTALFGASLHGSSAYCWCWSFGFVPRIVIEYVSFAKKCFNAPLESVEAFINKKISSLSSQVSQERRNSADAISSTEKLASNSKAKIFDVLIQSISKNSCGQNCEWLSWDNYRNEVEVGMNALIECRLKGIKVPLCPQ